MTRSRRTPLYPLPLRERVDASAASVRVRGVAKLHHARALRARMTDAERKLWFALRDRRFANFKFRRQAPIGPYIADYVCYAARVVIEVDGGQHVESEYDARRDSWLEAQDFVVLRFWNNDVLLNLEGVLTCLLDVLMKRTADGISRNDPSPASPLRGSAPSPTRGEGRERAS
jgi:very-short-patch-repair endonuclease